MSKRVLLPRVATAHHILFKQLAERGYDVGDYANASMQEISAMLENKQLTMLVSSPEGKKVRVIFHVVKALRPPNLLDYVEDAFHRTVDLAQTDELLLVAKDQPNDTLVAALERLWTEENKYVNVRGLDSLQFDILGHSLVPPHKVLQPEDVAIVKGKYSINEDRQFPEMSRQDAVAVALGVRPGEVVEITRPSRTSITGVYYRLCI
jgi:DNA-directed RNA polymerase subunit H